MGDRPVKPENFRKASATSGKTTRRAATTSGRRLKAISVLKSMLPMTMPMISIDSGPIICPMPEIASATGAGKRRPVKKSTSPQAMATMFTLVAILRQSTPPVPMSRLRAWLHRSMVWKAMNAVQ